MTETVPAPPANPSATPTARRLALYENFYPAMDRLGTHSTNLALLLLRSDPTLELHLTVPKRSTWPDGFDRSRVHFSPTWSHGRPISMLRAASAMGRSLPEGTPVLFNWFPTCYGETRSAAGAGMLLPRVVRTVSGRRPAVYAHNFIETQDVRRLGYRPGALDRWAVGLFERSLTRAARVFVPLESQRRSLEEMFRISVTARPIPFVEALYGHWVETERPDPKWAAGIPPRRSFRVLLFGVWGPAKDLASVLPVLDELFRSGVDIEVVFAGSVNRFFPEYRERLRSALASFPADRCQFVADPPDEATPALFGSADLVILPYHAIAGPSGVMGLAAFHGCRIVAYDVPELREYDAILDGRTVFVPRGDRAALSEAIRRCVQGEVRGSTETKESRVARAVAGARALLGDLESA